MLNHESFGKVRDYDAVSFLVNRGVEPAHAICKNPCHICGAAFSAEPGHTFCPVCTRRQLAEATVDRTYTGAVAYRARYWLIIRHDLGIDAELVEENAP